MKNIRNNPPKILELFMKLLIDDKEINHRLGDLQEVYEYKSQKSGVMTAIMWYVVQVFRYLPHSIIHNITRNFIMLNNYVKIAFRNLVRHKGFSFINISGLVLGITSCILILLWVQDEMSFDKFNKNYDNIYRIVQNGNFPVAVTPGPIGEFAAQEIPEIVDFARFRYIGGKSYIANGDRKYFEDKIGFADGSLFNLFSFKLLNGNKDNLFKDINSVLLSKSSVNKYFGDEDPIGKIIDLNGEGNLVVGGVYEDIPENSHLQFDFLLQYDYAKEVLGYNLEWDNNIVYTYLLVQDQANINELEAKIVDVHSKYSWNNMSLMSLQSFGDIHLRSNFNIDISGTSKNTETNVYIFSGIALLTLLIACLNFINLSTARANVRSKEIGMRIVSGAKRLDIKKQFLGESFIFATISVLLSIILTIIAMPYFNEISGKVFSADLLLSSNFLVLLFGILIFTVITSGIYPAFYMSSLNPIIIIKGGTKNKKSSFRKVMVVTQFSISIIIIIGSILISDQLDFIRNKNLGLNKDNVIYLNLSENLRNNFDTFKNEILTINNVSSVTRSSDIPTYTIHSAGGDWEGKSEDINGMMHHYSVDPDYFKTFNIEIVEGRALSWDMGDSEEESFAYVVNETTIKEKEIKNPLGKSFAVWGAQGTIVGVMKDFNFKSLHKKVEPLAFRILPSFDRYLIIKIDGSNTRETIEFIKEKYSTFEPTYPFDIKFLDEDFEVLYNNDKRFGEIFYTFSILAIIISCLGLIGLVSFFTEQRTKELGIRKVLGASPKSLLALLTNEFLILVGVANLLAWPISYYLMSGWLNNFSYHITIGVSTFLISGVLSIFIALITVSYKTITAVIANPSDILRTQ